MKLLVLLIKKWREAISEFFDLIAAYRGLGKIDIKITEADIKEDLYPRPREVQGQRTNIETLRDREKVVRRKIGNFH